MAPLAPGEVVDPDEVAIGHTPSPDARFAGRRSASDRAVSGGGSGVLVRTREQFRTAVLQCGQSSGVRSSSRQAKPHHPEKCSVPLFPKSALSLCFLCFSVSCVSSGVFTLPSETGGGLVASFTTANPNF